MSSTSSSRSAVTALLIGIGALILMLTLGVGAQLLAALGLIVLAPGFWWRHKTREFRSGVRYLRRGDGENAENHFRSFLLTAAREGGFLRYQAFFNLGRPYDYVAAAHNNLGALALQAGDRSTARREFDAAIALGTAFAPAYFGRAGVNLLEGDLGAAEEDAGAGLSAEPRYRPCSILLALIRAERGDSVGAEEVLAGLRTPISLDDARLLWAEMYDQWKAKDRAAKWEGK